MTKKVIFGQSQEKYQYCWHAVDNRLVLPCFKGHSKTNQLRWWTKSLWCKCKLETDSATLLGRTKLKWLMWWRDCQTVARLCYSHYLQHKLAFITVYCLRCIVTALLQTYYYLTRTRYLKDMISQTILYLKSPLFIINIDWYCKFFFIKLSCICKRTCLF